MTKKLTKPIATMMAALMLVLALGASSCFAATANVDGADSADTKVYLTQEATAFDFEVTERIDCTADANSNDMTVESLTVTNKSLSGQISYDLDATAKSPYSMDSYTADYANKAVDSKVFGLKADGTTDMKSGTYENAGTGLEANGGSETNTFTGKISTASAAVAETQIATITATVEWVK